MNRTPIRIGLMGADGNMGMMIARLGYQEPAIEFTAAYTIGSSPNIGKTLGSLVGQGNIGPILKDTEGMIADLAKNLVDVVIDFTVAKATQIYAPQLVKIGIPIVIGSTGLPDEFDGELKQLCASHSCSIVKSSNMATGVNLFFKIAAEIAKKLSDWDIEIIEAHHHRKKDAPSGTAIMVAQAIAEAVDVELNNVAKYGRPKGPAARKIGKDEIGIHAIRAGDIVGDHTVLYAGPGERIELVHRAHSRECFANGALNAAKFLELYKNEGKIYTMQDVLGL
jgi:4-hydroxy-tetrahydrodipicolinate reductase